MATRRADKPVPARQHFVLSPKQQKALDSKASIVIVGGGNGGGKSHLLRLAPLRPEYLGTASSRSALFAETNPKLEMADGLVDKCRELYPQVGGEYRASPKKRWTFPTHATVDLSYVGDPDQWDGSQIAFIGIDQAEQIDDAQFWSLQSRNRSSAAVPCQLMATANPPAEGKEHWLTRMLVAGGWIGADGFPVSEMDGKVRYFVRLGEEFAFADTQEELAPLRRRGSDGQLVPPMSMTFVQMLVKDHPLAEFRAAYEQKLSALTEVEQLRRWDGNWFATETAGRYFRKEFFPAIEYRPTHEARLVRSWDNAWSTSESADWTPGVLVSLEPDGYWTVLDLLRFRGTYRHLERAVKLVAELDGRRVLVRLPKDAGAAGGLQSELARWLGARGYEVQLTADRGDKLTRSKPYQACAERREVRLAKSHPSREVAMALTEPFVAHQSDGTRIEVPGLDVSGVSTLHSWHESYLADHVRFGRATVNKRSVKKDVVDAMTGAYEVLTSTAGTDPADVDDETLRHHLQQAQRDLGGGGAGGRFYGGGGGSRGFGGGTRGSRWL